MNVISKVLSQRHPFHESTLLYYRDILCITIGVGLVLYFLRPFGISALIDKEGASIVFMYLIMQWIPMTFSSLWVYYKGDKWRPNWTLGKELLWVTYQIFTISIALWIGESLLSSLGIGRSNPPPLDTFFLIVFLGSLFPVLVSQLIRHQYFMIKNLKKAKELNSVLEQKASTPLPKRQETPTPIPPNNKLKEWGIHITENSIYYIESDKNHIIIHAIENEKPQQFRIRMPLKQFEDSYNIQNSHFFRCHRAFIVNINKINRVTGNAAGLNLFLHSDFPKIPVSRNKVSDFKKIELV